MLPAATDDIGTDSTFPDGDVTLPAAGNSGIAVASSNSKIGFPPNIQSCTPTEGHEPLRQVVSAEPLTGIDTHSKTPQAAASHS